MVEVATVGLSLSVGLRTTQWWWISLGQSSMVSGDGGSWSAQLSVIREKRRDESEGEGGSVAGGREKQKMKKERKEA